jgi:hypothetical protein
MIGRSLSASVVNTGNLAAAEVFTRRLNDEAATAEARVAPLGRAAEQAGMAPADPRFATDPGALALTGRIEAALRSAVEDALAGAGAAGEAARWPPQGTLDVLRRDLYLRLETLAGTLYPQAGTDAKRAMAAWALARANAGLQSRTASWLEGGIDAMKRRAEATPASELELTRLEEAVRRDRELLQSFRAQLVASDVSQAVETTDLGTRIEIIDPAQAPLQPSRPNRSRILLAAVLVGPLVGLAFAMVAEIFDPTVRTLEDIRRIAPEPVFGTLPLLSALKPPARGIRRYWIPATVGGIVLLTAVFFAAKTTVLHDVGGAQPVRIIDPGEGASP